MILLFGVVAALAIGEWLVLGSVLLMAVLTSRQLGQAVRSIRVICSRRARLADPTTFDELVWAGRVVRGGGWDGHRPLRQASREITLGVAVVVLLIGLVAAEVIPIDNAGRLWIVLLPAMYFVMRVRRRLQLSAAERRLHDQREPRSSCALSRTTCCACAGEPSVFPGCRSFGYGRARWRRSWRTGRPP